MKVKWSKQGKYYATYKGYTISRNDVELFILYHNNEFLECGTKAQCLKVFNAHKDKK